MAVEPEVVLLSTDESSTLLHMQVVFKGMDKMSVKFDYNMDTDTAREVVEEMVCPPFWMLKFRFSLNP